MATRTQARTSWGYFEDYLLCCESKRTRKRLQQNQTGNAYIELLSDNEESATKKKSKQGKRLKQTTIKYKEYKFSVGDQVRKRFDDGWHNGTIVDRGVQGVDNTYQMSCDDAEFEIIKETKLEKFVSKRRDSL